MNLKMTKYWRVDSSFKVAGITVTDEGFWEIEGVAAVVGPMVYVDAEGNEHIEYATPAVLKDYAHTLVGKPVTNDHPPRRVNPGNYKVYTIGTVLAAWYEDETGQLRVNLVVNDADAQSDIDRGRIELSPGYLAGLSEPPPDFEHEADYIQVSRTYNHLAIVDEARGGGTVRLHLDSKGDASMKDKEKDDKTKEDAKENFDALKEKYDALQAKYDALAAKMDAMQEKKDAEDEEKEDADKEKENADSVDFDTRFAEAFEEHRRAVEAAGRLGVEVGRKDSTFSIKQKVATAKLGKNFRADASKEYIEAAFDSVVELYPSRDSAENLSGVLRNDGVQTNDGEYGFLDNVVDPLESLKANRSNK